MRRTDLPQLVAAVREPMKRFVRESRARIALLVSGSGQVLAQHGFARSYEVMNVASLAAAAHASARALSDLIQAGGWTHLHHAGRERQLFMAPLQTPVERLILVVIFDGTSSLGLVQLFFDLLGREVALLPEFQAALPGSNQEGFERDLEAGLDRLFPAERQDQD